MPRERRLRRWPARGAIVLAGLLLAAEAIYLVAANYYLNDDRLLARINRRPEKFSMRWDGAWTPWPGSVRLRGIAMRGRSRRIDWYARIETVSASFRVLSLFDRNVHLRNVSASGVDYRQRRMNRDAAAEEAGLPPLPDVGTQPATSGGEPERGRGGSKPEKKPWTVVADDIDAAIDQLWLGRYRLTGPMTLDTSMDLIVRETTAFPRIEFVMDGAAVTMDGKAMLEGLDLDARTALPAFGRGGRPLRDVVRALSGRFVVQAEGARLFFLEAYFRKAPWLDFNSRAPLQADLRIDAGRLMPGSTLESSTEAVSVDLLDQRLTGEGRIAMRVEDSQGGPRSVLEAVLDPFEVTSRGQDKPFATGHGFKVTATSSALSFEDLFTTLEVQADLPEATIADLSRYNRYIPRDSGVVIRKGTGRISYHFEGNQDEKSLHGWTNLSATDGHLQFENYEMRGDVTIRTLVRNVDFARSWFDISGTTIAMKSRNFPWTARIELPRAKVRYSEPMQIDADVAFRMTDTAPLVALFDARKDISGFVERLMMIDDVRGRTGLRLDEKGTKITGLDITGEDLTLLADLALGAAGRDGILYVKLGALSFGLAYDQGEKDIDIIRARKWFDKQRAMRRAGVAR